jgi:hypothetical protein
MVLKFLAATTCTTQQGMTWPQAFAFIGACAAAAFIAWAVSRIPK